MRSPSRPHALSAGVPAVARVGAALAIAVLVVAGCGASPSPSPGDRTPGPVDTSSPVTPTEVPGGDGRTPAPEPGTFETAWGEARDGLPSWFPLPAHAEPADPPDPAEGPVSGTFVVGSAPDDVVQQVQAGLIAAGYSTEALSGPYEDGSLVVDSVGLDPECRVQTRVRGLSGVTMITVLYAAACPWD